MKGSYGRKSTVLNRKSQAITLRLPPDLFKALKDSAYAANESVNLHINKIVVKALGGLGEKN